MSIDEYAKKYIMTREICAKDRELVKENSYLVKKIDNKLA